MANPTAVDLLAGRAPAPQTAIPWEALAGLAAEALASARSAVILVGITDGMIHDACRHGLDDLMRRHGATYWLHIEGHQVVALVSELSLENAYLLSLAVRGVLEDLEHGSPSASVGTVALADPRAFSQVGASAERSARAAWNKEPDHVVC
jgi:hypothetical protein